MRISVFGLGYVGAVSCGCLAELGHVVIGVDVVSSKVERIGRGESPIIERGLDEILRRAVASGRLSATVDARQAVEASDAALICVGTPSTPLGGVESVYLERVCHQIGTAVRESAHESFLILNRSTSLPPIHRRLQAILTEASGRPMGQGIGYVCHPEFLREGAAIEDFYKPPKIVFGATDERSEELCRELYPGIDAEVFFMTSDQAAMVKYADNCFHALKVSFGNEIGMICKSYGIDSHAVMDVFCRDRKLNISDKYLRPGLAFGGSCLPKDLRGIFDGARETATRLPLLTGALESNRIQIERLLTLLASHERPAVGIIGLSFKEGTDDVRESPLVTVVEQLSGKGYPIRVYDEHLAMQRLEGANLSFALRSIPHLSDMLTRDLQAVIDTADVILVSHRLSKERWMAVQWPKDRRLIDLVNIPELRSYPGYEGLYW